MLFAGLYNNCNNQVPQLRGFFLCLEGEGIKGGGGPEVVPLLDYNPL